MAGVRLTLTHVFHGVRRRSRSSSSVHASWRRGSRLFTNGALPASTPQPAHGAVPAPAVLSLGEVCPQEADPPDRLALADRDLRLGDHREQLQPGWARPPNGLLLHTGGPAIGLYAVPALDEPALEHPEPGGCP